MTPNRLAGHELPFEGHACELNRYSVPTKTREWVGHTYCSCGERSPELRTNNARKRWHREHKDKIRAGMTGADT